MKAGVKKIYIYKEMGKKSSTYCDQEDISKINRYGSINDEWGGKGEEPYLIHVMGGGIVVREVSANGNLLCLCNIGTGRM